MERVRRAAEILQLSELLDRKPSQLSGGQRQRAAIGRAIVRDPKVFLFDEPLSNLDAKLRAEMRIEIKKLHQRLGATMVYVTHDQIEAMTVADEIAVMNGGVIEQLADPQTLYDLPETRFVAGFIGSPAMNFLDGEIVHATGAVAAAVGGHRLPLDHYPFRERIEAGRPVVVGIRPEKIGPAAAMDGDFVAEVTPDFREPMGADTLVWFDFAGRPVSARLSPPTVPAARQPLRLAFDLSTVSLFDPATGQRL
jgi:multiple sugar transport system ATP-binding protein